ncbi:hypothetical protein [Streptomyces lasiicapitis]|uniref:Uncharacterized protein n=1 Tax=Streptomyces lasiicapitis TaxID=1923961 RepID=A0ABQ2MWJ2_9ACTN|nr:hypothetical protein [Streptomyces lasiicapitis]GGO60113.1 hypothetical protein GCM10012286_83260 [Streptomyces lasiicapitis]
MTATTDPHHVPLPPEEPSLPAPPDDNGDAGGAGGGEKASKRWWATAAVKRLPRLPRTGSKPASGPPAREERPADLPDGGDGEQLHDAEQPEHADADGDGNAGRDEPVVARARPDTRRARRRARLTRRPTTPADDVQDDDVQDDEEGAQRDEENNERVHARAVNKRAARDKRRRSPRRSRSYDTRDLHQWWWSLAPSARFLIYNGPAAVVGYVSHWPQNIRSLLNECHQETDNVLAAVIVGVVLCVVVDHFLDRRSRHWWGPLPWLCRIPLASCVLGVLIFAPGA